MVAAAVAAGAAVAGGAMSASASRSAAKKQANAAEAATQAQLEQYNQTREDLAPYREAGGYGLEQLLAGYKDGSLLKGYDGSQLYQDPSYKFRLNEGLGAVQSGAASQGGLLSGATLRALNNYGQEAASQEYNNAYTRYTNDQQNRYARLKDLANMGQNSAVQTGTMGQSAVGAAGANMMQGANASAAGTIGANNAWTNSIGQLGSIATAYMNNRNTGTKVV
ncbi:DNA transfer protein p32 [Acinetobacter baumannii]|uniref:DNA transfer protein p32 n=1 Tax=Acinetobacter baumannii TaxID=470 RepID=UPI003A856316